MSVTTTDTSESYVGDGATTEFPVPFPYLAAAHLLVTLAGVTQTLDVDYTVADGTVTFATAPADDAAVVIGRTVPLTQETAFRTQGSFSPALHEDALDKLTMGLQQAARDLDVVSDARDATQAQLDALILDVAAVQTADLSITTAKLADGAVTTPKLAAGAVTTAKLDDGAVTTAKLADAAVTVAKMVPAAYAESDTITDSTSSLLTYVPLEQGADVLEVTLTSTGRPIVVALMPTAGGSAVSASVATGADLGLSMDNGASFLREWHFAAGATSMALGVLYVLPAVGPGALTLRMYARVLDGADSIGVTAVKLVAFEI